MSYQYQTDETASSNEDQALPVISSPDDSELEGLGPLRASADMFQDDPNAGVFWYKLHRTSLNKGREVRAKVRLPSFANRAIINELPKDIQKVAADLMFANNASTPTKYSNMDNMKRVTKRGEEVANLYCVVGFIEPKLCMKPEQEVPGQTVWVGRIPFEDRWDFVRVADGEDSIAARRITPFSEE